MPPGLDYTYTTTTFPYTNIITSNTIDCSGTLFSFTQKDIDELARKIYKVFSEHIPIDISEDEFMELLKEE